VGVTTTTPQKEAGQEIEPPVDSAIAIWGTSAGREAVRHAAPPEEPPQLLLGSSGFFGTP